MRVLIAVGHSGIYAGGAHQALYSLIGLKREGVEVGAVWGPDAENDPHGFDRLKELDIPFWILPIHRKPDWRNIRAFRRIIIPLRGATEDERTPPFIPPQAGGESASILREILQEFKPDVVEAVKSGAQYYTLTAGIGLNRHALVFYRGISRPMDYFQEFKYRLKRVDKIIANCRDLKEIMTRSGRIPVEKVEVVPGEFDPACSEPDQVDASGLRSEMGISDGVPVIIQLGNYASWRGQVFTLKAAKILKNRGYRFHLVFCGRETDVLKPLVKELGLNECVTLSPYRRDPQRVLKMSNIAVNASTANESLPGSLLNIQAMGVPAVATTMPGASEIVEDGVTGWLVPPGDVEALADRLARLLALPKAERQEWGKRAYARAHRLFSSESRTAKRLKVYRQAIEIRKLKNEGTK